MGLRKQGYQVNEALYGEIQKEIICVPMTTVTSRFEISTKNFYDKYRLVYVKEVQTTPILDQDLSLEGEWNQNILICR